MQLDLFPAGARQPMPPALKLLPIKCCCSLKQAEAVLDVAIADIINGWPMIDCSGAHRLLELEDAYLLQILRGDGTPAVIPKADLPYSTVQRMRSAGVASFRYEGKRVHVRLNARRIYEIGAESRRRFLACTGAEAA